MTARPRVQLRACTVERVNLGYRERRAFEDSVSKMRRLAGFDSDGYEPGAA